MRDAQFCCRMSAMDWQQPVVTVRDFSSSATCFAEPIESKARTGHSDVDVVGFHAADSICRLCASISRYEHYDAHDIRVDPHCFWHYLPAPTDDLSTRTLAEDKHCDSFALGSWLQEIYEGLGHPIYYFGRVLDCVGTRVSSTFWIVFGHVSGDLVERMRFDLDGNAALLLSGCGTWTFG